MYKVVFYICNWSVELNVHKSSMHYVEKCFIYKMVHVILDQPTYMGAFTQIQKG